MEPKPVICLPVIISYPVEAAELRGFCLSGMQKQSPTKGGGRILFAVFF